MQTPISECQLPAESVNIRDDVHDGKESLRLRMIHRGTERHLSQDHSEQAVQTRTIIYKTHLDRKGL